jgi:predicted nucleotidyltransferase
MGRSNLDRYIAAIVNQVVDLVHPRRIILFGSANSGTWHPDSDIDLLVEVEDNQASNSVLDLLNTQVRREKVPCDFVVATTGTFNRYGTNPGLIYKDIVEKGRVVYAA